MKQFRNFSIIAHIDHGKSTLADRFIEFCGALSQREMEVQVLDSMDLERERGITIKAQTAQLEYKALDGNTYYLNLIDTPGHVDFSYEVSRSLSACEGAILVVDATQGVQAQTVANCYTAIDLNIEILPVINKIDLPSADPEGVEKQIEDVIGVPAHGVSIHCSAKSGQGIQDVLEAVVRQIPEPKGDASAPLRALIIDSWFDSYVGVVILVRIVDGSLYKKQKIRLLSSGVEYVVESTGVFTPRSCTRELLETGEVGYVISGIKDINAAKVGDTVVVAGSVQDVVPLPGFREVKPQVFAGLYPVESNQYEALRESLEKLCLNDASLSVEKEVSDALGYGFRCGFLGLLHMDVVQERLEREYGMCLVTTAPSVIYEVITKKGELIQVQNPACLPPLDRVQEIREPIITCTIFTPHDYVGAIIGLCTLKRGVQIDLLYYGNQVKLIYDMPLNEVVVDFFDRLKSMSRGYASLDYDFKEYRAANVLRLDILVNGERVDALSAIVHRANAQYRGRELASKLRSIIPRQMFDVAIQAALGSVIVARETVKALRKNVIAKCYGGDITRKKKLLERQKEGKKRMKQVGNVDIPQEAFLAVLRTDHEG